MQKQVIVVGNADPEIINSLVRHIHLTNVLANMVGELGPIAIMALGKHISTAMITMNGLLSVIFGREIINTVKKVVNDFETAHPEDGSNPVLPAWVVEHYKVIREQLTKVQEDQASARTSA